MLLVPVLVTLAWAQPRPEVFAGNSSNPHGAVLSLRHDAANGTGAPQLGLNPDYPPSLPAWVALKQRDPQSAAPYDPCAALLIQATGEIRRVAPLMRQQGHLAELNAGIKRAKQLIAQADGCLQKAVVTPAPVLLTGGINTPGGSAHPAGTGGVGLSGGAGTIDDQWPAGVPQTGPQFAEYTEGDPGCRMASRRTVLARGLHPHPAGCEINRKGEFWCTAAGVQSLCSGVRDATVAKLSTKFGSERLLAGWIDSRCRVRCRADLFEPDPNERRPLTASARQPGATPGLTKVICNARELVERIFERYGTGNPIRIMKLNQAKDTYMILLSGTEFRAGQATDLETDVRLALGGRDAFRLAVLERAQQLIPRGSRVILAGHSMGGMVAEGLAGDRRFQQLYRTQQVITFGSAIVPGLDQAGIRYTRFAADRDPVPGLTLGNDVPNRAFIHVGYGKSGDPLAAHLSYPNLAELEGYDLGCLSWVGYWDFPVPNIR